MTLYPSMSPGRQIAIYRALRHWANKERSVPKRAIPGGAKELSCKAYYLRAPAGTRKT